MKIRFETVTVELSYHDAMVIRDVLEMFPMSDQFKSVPRETRERAEAIREALSNLNNRGGFNV